MRSLQAEITTRAGDVDHDENHRQSPREEKKRVHQAAFRAALRSISAVTSCCMTGFWIFARGT